MADHRNAGLDLVWSLWTELGVPGPWRRHRAVILDPEWLIVATPWFARDDARLMDLVFSWCVRHEHRISGSRVAALARQDLDLWSAAEPFLAELAASGIRWIKVEPLNAARPREIRPIEVPVDRPALLRLRLRALAGVGGRAEVLTALLATADRWATAASLGEVGLAKRNVARVLTELAEAAIVHDRRRGNAREFRLVAPATLGQLVGLPPDPVFPDWRAVFGWLRLANELDSLSPERPASLRIEVARGAESLAALASLLWIEAPERSEDPAALLAWVDSNARAMAEGTGGGLAAQGRTP